MVFGARLHPSIEDLHELVDRLAATGAQVFLATLPRPSLLPVTTAKKEAMEAAGLAGADERIATIDGMAESANAALREKATEYPNVHAVELAHGVGLIESVGLAAGDQLLGVDRFQGLLGLDGVHFTDAGYGLLANLFIHTINLELGMNIPGVDLGAVVAADPESSAALVAAGLEVSQCE